MPAISPGRRLTAFPITAILLAIILAVSGCASDEDPPLRIPNNYGLTAAEQLPPAVQQIKDRGWLSVGISTDQPGFGAEDPDTGEIKGFDAEMARLMAIRIFGDPSKVRFLQISSAQRPTVLQNGRADLVVSTYTITPERAKIVGFVGPYFEAGQDILVRTPDTSIRSVADLARLRVCTQAGTTSLQQIEKAQPEAIIATEPTFTACAEGLSSGRYDAVTTDNVILAGLAAESRGTLRLVGKRFSDEPYGIGIRKQDQELRAFVHSTLSEVMINGDWTRAWVQTLSSFLGDAPIPPDLVVSPGT
jgi:glutamate transport system substrate-binding protein